MVDEGVCGGDGEPPLLALQDANIHPDLVLAPPVHLMQVGWTRQEILVDGIRQARVLFDNFSHDTGVQRGWCVCPVHPGCVRWRQCSGTLEFFCAEMCLWAISHDRDECNPENGGWHLGWTPSAQDVTSFVEHCVIQGY